MSSGFKTNSLELVQIAMQSFFKVVSGCLEASTKKEALS
jgi:hypothetical protein